MTLRADDVTALRPTHALDRVRLQQQVVSRVSSSAQAQSGDVLGLCRLITRSAAQLLGIERVSVWLYNDAKDELHLQDLYRLSVDAHSDGAVLSQAAFHDEFSYMLTAKYVDANEPLTDPRTKGYAESYLIPNRITAMLDAVVRLGEELVGTVCLEHVDTVHQWREDEIVFASQLGDQVALTFSMARTRAATALLQQRDAELQALNQSLAQRVEERTLALQTAHRALIEQERLAALGSAVAGVAHELSTPLGNARLSATTLVDISREAEAMLLSGRVSRSQLNHLIEQQRQAAQIIERNLEAATSLIVAFKNVAVDQTGAGRRRYALRRLVDDVLTSLRPTLTRSPCALQVQVDIDPTLELDGPPGALIQVLTNLVTNALQHAFEGRSQGCLRVQAEPLPAQRLRLTVSDDGLGIAAEVLPHVFEPFFTTRAGRGGSGLGLNLVQSLVTQSLGGEVQLLSQPGAGTRVVIELPLRAP